MKAQAFGLLPPGRRSAYAAFEAAVAQARVERIRAEEAAHETEVQLQAAKQLSGAALPPAARAARAAWFSKLSQAMLLEVQAARAHAEAAALRPGTIGQEQEAWERIAARRQERALELVTLIESLLGAA